MFMEPFLDNSAHVAWGYYPAEKKSFCSNASMLLRMHLIGNSTLNPVAVNHRVSFIKGPNMCHRIKKKTTHQHATAWCVAWLMHVLMWIFLHTLVFSSVWNSRNWDSSVFPVYWSIFVLRSSWKCHQSLFIGSSFSVTQKTIKGTLIL